MLLIQKILVILLVVFVIKTAFLVLFSFLHKLRDSNRDKGDQAYNPLVSVLVPAFNEELTITNCIKSIDDQSYRNYEIILVDDGSEDNTYMIGKELESSINNLRVFSKSNGGKNTALNFGLNYSKGDIVICVDADTVLDKDALKNIVPYFADGKTAAVSGNIKVANKNSFLGVNQALEYVNSIGMQRRAFAFFNTSHVVPGAIGAFRKDKIVEAGYYTDKTLVEDMDLTMRLASMGEIIDFCASSIAYTEAPNELGELKKQRKRWKYGTLQVLSKYKSEFITSNCSIFKFLLYPYLLIFSLLDVATLILFLCTLIISFYTGNYGDLILYFVIFVYLRIAISLYSILLMDDSKKLTLIALQDNLFYNHFISAVSLLSFLYFIFGRSVSWAKMNRIGLNRLPSYH